MEPEIDLSTERCLTDSRDALIEPPLEASKEPFSDFPPSFIDAPEDASASMSNVLTSGSETEAPEDASISALSAFKFLRLISAPDDASMSSDLQ